MTKQSLFNWLLPAVLSLTLVLALLFVANPTPSQVSTSLQLAVLATLLATLATTVWRLYRQRQQVKQLKQQQAYLSSIIDNAAEAFITIDEAGSIGLFNRAAERMFGYSAAETFGQSITMLMPEPYRSQHGQYIQRYLQSGRKTATGFEINAKGIRKNGELFPLHLATSEFYADNKRQFVGIIADKSEQHRMERALQTSEKRYRAVVNALTEGVLIHDGEGKVLALNPAAARIFGVGEAELQSLGAFKLWQECQSEDGVPIALSEQLAPGRQSKQVLSLLRPDGNRIWLRLNCQPLLPDEAEPPLNLMVFHDISRMHAADEQVHLLLRGIESMSTGFLIADALKPELPTVFVNDGFCRMTGYAKEDIQGKSSRFWQDEDNDPATLRLLEQAISIAKPVSLLMRSTRRDGSRFWNNMSLAPIYDSHNLLTHFVAEQHDISAQVEAVEAVRLNEQHWREALESTGMGVYEYNVLTGEIHFSPSWLALLGYQPEMVNGPTSLWNALVHPDDVASRNQSLRALLSDMAPFVETRYRVRRQNGQYCWVLTKGAVIERDYADQPLLVRGTISDISLQKEAEAFLVDQQTRLSQLVAARTTELELALNEARSADRLKDEFIANMSHEIRTPMNAIIGFAELALSTSLDAQQLDYLQKVREAAKSLLGIINDILDFSKYRSGKFTLDIHPFRLDDICRQSLAMIESQTDRKGLRLISDWPDSLCGVYLGDALRIKQILINLLSNAVKFTEQGYVSLQLRNLEETARAVRCEFIIRDSGIGMDTETQLNLFNQFMQADASTTRRFGGTGLGLAICRQLLEAMRGNISVDSSVGQGSEFRIELLLEKSDQQLETPGMLKPSEFSLRGLRVLLVEDNGFNRQYARELLQDAGAEVDEAVNGVEALDAVATHSYDLVLMDMQMPVMDGLEATRRIRVLPRGARLPIIAMTASARPEDRSQALAAGMDDYLSKPIELETFWLTLARWCPAKTPSPAAPAPAPPASTQPILLMEALRQFDTSGALARMRGDQERYRRLLDHFAEHWRHGLHDMRQFADQQAWDELKRLAHTLKGGASTIGAIELAEAANKLEKACHETPPRELSDLLERVSGQMGQALVWIKQALQPLPAEQAIDENDE
ncbi:PAS domain S-box protein [Chromobacterium sp. IIBBL 290-4]|uniref:PAS domain S-box protein n=1 Tax=Chromobacterium sp. IIBBL 290-4 TaxID=2953890 RepID=UPI0020B82372|nr:PAS domain S-box protein [Chromobacterium sp. IIBBL 290-4]UTH76685.1 PAS domain S-box protein [Chromobacterium sp. IIBBL 290-4]